MRVEANCYIIKRTKGEELIKSHSVSPGSWEKVGFFGAQTKIAVFCSLDKDRGSVLIRDPKRKIQAFVFENDEDTKGRQVKTNSPISIQGEQILSIVPERGKLEKEVVIFLNSEDDRNWGNNPEDEFDEDFDPTPKIPIGIS